MRTRPGRRARSEAEPARKTGRSHGLRDESRLTFGQRPAPVELGGGIAEVARGPSISMVETMALLG